MFHKHTYLTTVHTLIKPFNSTIYDKIEPKMNEGTSHVKFITKQLDIEIPP